MDRIFCSKSTSYPVVRFCPFGLHCYNDTFDVGCGHFCYDASSCVSGNIQLTQYIVILNYSWFEEQRMSRGNKDYGYWNASGDSMLAICSYIIGKKRSRKVNICDCFSASFCL